MPGRIATLFDLGFGRAAEPAAAEPAVDAVREERLTVETTRPSPALHGIGAVGLASAASWFSRAFPSVLGAPKSEGPGSGAESVWFAVGQAALVLLGGAVLLGALASLVHFLRGRRNPLYWELACWILVVLGIVVRPLVASQSVSLGLGALFTSAAIGVAVLPSLMRWLNRVSRRPGLQHVAVPFSLGFFIDLTQVLTSRYVVRLPWLSA